MAVSHIIKELQNSLATDKRNFQYKAHIVDYTFNTQLLADELVSSMASYVNNRRALYIDAPPVSRAELAEFRKAAVEAIKKEYTYTKVRQAHSKHGFRVFSDNATAEQRLASYSGFSSGTITPKVPNKGKLACIVYRHLAANSPPYSGRYQGLSAGITCTYAASMMVSIGDDKHNQVVKHLWYKAVAQHKIEVTKAFKQQLNLGNNVAPMAGELRIGSDRVTGRTRHRRLHGPGASKSGGGYITGDKEDTSEKVIGIIDMMKEMSPGNVPMPAGVTQHKNYALAHKEILKELDLEFVVNSNSITDIVTLGKHIRIKMSSGGDQHQHFMSHADKSSVDEIVKNIENKLLNSEEGLKNEEFRTSDSISTMARKAVSAQIVKHFVTKHGKPDMRYKVNKQAALKAAKRKKESSAGTLPFFIAGKSKVTKRQKAKRSTKSDKLERSGNRKVQNQKSGVALKELINAALPDALLQRMHPPALRNRTGRFRNSAEVTNVNMGPRGGTQIDYTYMRDPYQTFEPGGAMGSTGRDPRRLIGGTVREIAQQITGNKFITTRRR